MMKLLVIFIIFALNFHKGIGQKNQELRIGVLYEPYQSDIREQLSIIFKESEGNGGPVINTNYLEVNRGEMETNFGSVCEMLSNGLTIMLDFTWENPWPNLINSLRTSKIPYLRIDVSIRPFVRAFLRFIREIDTHDVGLIFQNENEQYEGIIEILNQLSIRSITFSTLNETIAERVLRIRPMPTNLAILADADEMDKLYQMALKYKIIERPTRWSLIYLSFPSTHQRKQNEMILADMKQFVPTVDMCCTYLGLDTNQQCSCSNKNSIPEAFLRDLLTKLIPMLAKSVDFNVIRSLNCDNDVSNITDTLSSTDMDVSITNFEAKFRENVVALSNLVLFQPDKSPYSVEFLLNILMLGHNASAERTPDETPVLKELALIDNSAFSLLKNSTIATPRRFFRIGIAPAIPWTYVKKDPRTKKPILDNNGNPIYEGYCIDFARKLAEKLDFDYELILTKTGSFGDRIPHLNNTWDGLVGDLMVGDIDIAVAAMKMTAEREEVIDFVAPYFEQTGVLIVIRKPVRHTSLFKFMTVLRVEVWLSIVGAIISTSIMMWILDKYSPYSAKNNRAAYPYECRDFTFKESLWFAMTSFTPQGGGEAPKSLSSRTLVAAYWLFVVLMLATFTANLAAFLTVERMQTPVQSLDQLARQSRINYTVVEGSDTHKYFINMKFAEDTLYRMWKELTLNSTADQTQYRVWDYPIKEQYGHILLAINGSNPVATAEEGFRNVNEHENADYAFIHDAAEIKYEISRNCNLTEVGEVFAEQPYSVAIQQGSQLQDELSKAILELQKDRFFEALTAKYWNNSAKGVCSGEGESEGITLESLGGVFIATLFGLALAMITLVIEIIYYRRKETQKNSVQMLKPQVNERQTTPPPSYEQNESRMKSRMPFLRNLIGDKNTKEITMGSEFVPASMTNPKRVSYISVYPRKSVHSERERNILID